MLRYVEGDIFNSPALVLVNTVNTVGVMGKGIALGFKQRYPEMFAEYRQACDKGKVQIGRLMMWYGTDHWILNFPTKEHWRRPSRIEYIEKGLMTFCRKYADYNITSIAFPRLGCGNGELSWDEVRPLMERYLGDLPIDIYIYLSTLGDSQPEHWDQVTMAAWLKEHAKDMSFTGMKDELAYSSALLPLSFISDNRQWTARWDDMKGVLLLRLADEEQVIVEEQLLQEIWSSIQNKGIFEVSDDPVWNLVYQLLFAMGYLTRVRIQEDAGQTYAEGFQLDAGQGRYYSLKG